MQPAGYGADDRRVWSYAESHTFAELLIDCEEDRSLPAVLVGMLRETERWCRNIWGE